MSEEIHDLRHGLEALRSISPQAGPASLSPGEADEEAQLVSAAKAEQQPADSGLAARLDEVGRRLDEVDQWMQAFKTQAAEMSESESRMKKRIFERVDEVCSPLLITIYGHIDPRFYSLEVCSPLLITIYGHIDPRGLLSPSLCPYMLITALQLDSTPSGSRSAPQRSPLSRSFNPSLAYDSHRSSSK